MAHGKGEAAGREPGGAECSYDQEVESDGRIALLVRYANYGTLDLNLEHSAEIRFDFEGAPSISLRAGSDVPQLEAEYVLVQPDIVEATGGRQGWLPLGGRFDEELYLSDHASEEAGLDPMSRSPAWVDCRG